MSRRSALFLCALVLALPAVAQSWIWYPGDMDIWMGNRINNLRTERGSFYPAFWRADSHEQTVEFQKAIELAEAEDVEIRAEGQYGIKIDNHGYLFGMPGRFTVPKGRHTLHIAVHNKVAPPALWLKGKNIQSDTTWTVTNYAVPMRADTWTEADGRLTFTNPHQRPSDYHLPVTAINPINVQPNGKEIFAEWEREGIGYLQLNINKQNINRYETTINHLLGSVAVGDGTGSVSPHPQ